MKKRIHFLLWCLFAFVAFKYMRHAIHDGDTWWHLANGRYMLDHHVFLRSDVFSHTLNNALWINFEWLSEIFMAGVVKGFGIPGLFAAKVLLGMTAVGLLILLLRAAGARGTSLLVLSWVGYHLMQVRLCTRVELATLNLLPFLVTLVLLIPHLQARYQKFLPLVFFGVMVLWCNLHGGFIYGLLVLSAFCVGARWAKWPKMAIVTLDRSMLFSLVAILINPYGPRLIEPFMQHLSDFKHQSGLIAEWDKPTFESAPLFWICGAGGLLLMLTALIRRQKPALFWVPAGLMMLALGMMTERNTPLLAFAILPLAAWQFSRVQKPRFAWCVNLAFLAAFLWVEKDYLLKPLPKGLIDGNVTPIRACRFVRENNIEGVMYNSYGYGGVIEWELGPGRKAFMDGRYIFYPLLVESENLMRGKVGNFTSAAWQDYFSKHGVDYAITKFEPLRIMRDWDKPVKHESVMDIMFPRDNWACVYWDSAGFVFLRRGKKFEKLIAQKEIIVNF